MSNCIKDFIDFVFLSIMSKCRFIHSVNTLFLIFYIFKLYPITIGQRENISVLSLVNIRAVSSVIMGLVQRLLLALLFVLVYTGIFFIFIFSFIA